LHFRFKRFHTKRGQQVEHREKSHQALDIDIELIPKGKQFKGDIVSEQIDASTHALRLKYPIELRSKDDKIRGVVDLGL
jgi:hypothetical protein